jgi:hypothetical protein
MNNMNSCRLCRSPSGGLKKSHLLARAFYARIRNKTGSDPVIVTPTQITQKSGQVKDFLLCAVCEGRLNKRGEKWTLENYPQLDGSFPLQSALLKATPFKEQNGDKYYRGNSVQGVDLDKLGYFAVSVYWRAGVHQWDFLDRTDKLSLGPYEKALRLYLLDEAPFPKKAALHILVSPAQEPRDGILFPSTYREKPFHCHGFSIPGITFALSLGNISAEERDECAIHSNTLLLTNKADELVASAERKFINKRTLP